MADQSRVNPTGADAVRSRTQRIACVLLERRSHLQQDALTAFAEACFRFSSQIAIRPGEAVFIEVGGSRRIFSEASLTARLKILAGRMLSRVDSVHPRVKSSPVRIGIGDSAASALAAARFPEYARTRDFKQLPLAALLDYANPFLWDADLEKRVLRITCILESLGIRDLAGFLLLPRESLASRLGKEAGGLVARVWGELEAAWPGFHPLPSIIERDEVRDPEAHGLCIDLEGCLFVLRGLIDRAMARLRGRGERALVVEIRFGVEPRQRELRVEFSLPQGSAMGMIPILRDKLAYELRRAPFGAPVEVVEIEIIESVPGSGPQRDFFSKKEEEREAWDALVARLSARLGKERIFVAFPRDRHLPERAFVRKHVSVPTIVGRSVEILEAPDRPARVLKKPEPLLKEGRMLKNSEGRKWKALSWEGPERLSGEWWRDSQFEGFNRDYYRVITEGGEQLWVFVNKKVTGNSVGNSKEPSFYLHGYFD